MGNVFTDAWPTVTGTACIIIICMALPESPWAGLLEQEVKNAAERDRHTSATGQTGRPSGAGSITQFALQDIIPLRWDYELSQPDFTVSSTNITQSSK